MLALLPIVLLAALLTAIVRGGVTDAVRGTAVPPVERLVFSRVVLSPGAITLSILNDGPDPVTVAQVVVDDAFWTFAAEPSTRLAHLGRATVRIPYPWVHGESHTLRLVTSSGVTFDHVIPVAVETPVPSAKTFGVFTLIGVYVGVLPVAIGLMWYPLVRKLGRGGLDFTIALTLGLLAFLFVDAAHEGLGLAAGMPESYQGIVLFAAGAAAACLALEAVSRHLLVRRRDDARRGWVLALLVAIGIGLHNLGEGLAIGAAFGLGEVALGTLLVVGFTLHNTTEGLAIVSPLAREQQAGARPPLPALIALGVIGGAPTIAGAWIGGLAYSPVWTLVFLGLGVGAIAQVMAQILRQTTGSRPVIGYLTGGPVLAGLAAGIAVMYATGMLIG
jgi:zinc transporter ZupT